MSATIEDVAKLAGVGKSTVSRVITNHPNVRRSTRDRVEAAIRKLDYKPNIYARNILHKRSNAAVLVFMDTVKALLQYNAYFVEIMHGIEDEARKLDFLVAPQTLERDKNNEYAIPGIVDQNRADGLLLLGHVPDSFLIRLRRADKRFVSVEAASLGESIDCVIPDYFTAGLQATQHLIELGHTRIGFAVAHKEEPIWSIQERLRGYRWALETADLPYRADLLFKYDDQERFWAGQRLADQILAKPRQTSAVIFLDDSVAIRTIQALSAANVQVPDDLSIVGYGDNDTAAQADPALTTIHAPTAELGRRGLRRLVDIIEHGSGLPEKRVLPTSLVRRASTAAPRE
ncbi:MAG: LacI family transcriptional regulator [bacterium]|nr:LacI family transcriptional regulator [bacterium]